MGVPVKPMRTVQATRLLKTPTFEFDHDQSVANRLAVEAFIKKTGAQLGIEHDRESQARASRSSRSSRCSMRCVGLYH